MDETYYLYEGYASRDVKIILRDKTIVKGYLDTVIPADEVSDEQVLLTLVTDTSKDVEILANDIESIEEIKK